MLQESPVSALPGYREREKAQPAWNFCLERGRVRQGTVSIEWGLVYVCKSEQEGGREKEKVAIESGGFALWERSQSNYRQQCKSGFFSWAKFHISSVSSLLSLLCYTLSLFLSSSCCRWMAGIGLYSEKSCNINMGATRARSNIAEIILLKFI